VNQLNSILIEGDLTQDPVLKELPKVPTVCSFSIASKRFYRQGDEIVEEVSCFDIETRGKLADSCGIQLKKGRGVRIVGRLRQELEDFDGKNVSRVYVVAEHVEFKPEAKKGGGDER
jgi:single-strand DNA-binding protein